MVIPRLRQAVISRITLTMGASALIVSPVLGQTQTARSARVTAPTVAYAVPADPKPPTIDGRVDDDPGWANSPILSDFTQRDPNEGEPGTERTEVVVTYTNDALYVGVRAFDSQPDQITAQLTRRDAHSPSDWIAISIDSYHDRRTAFQFMVNPAGVKRDIYLFDDTNQDDSWDAVWDVKTSRDELGWSAEFRIPFSQLRFPKADENVFGFNVYRRINRLNEEQYWKLLPKEESGVVSRFGDLNGIRGIDPPRRIEILPYTVGTQAYAPSVDGDPFRDGNTMAANVGADINVGLTSNITLSATVNPDFGQVEADPAVVNLSAFETFFPEKRPFFTEGLDIFQFPLGSGDGGRETLFYTRRIGRRPQGSADARGGYAESLNHTTIYTAAKISGKTPSGWTLGLVGAATAEERASVRDSIGTRHQDVVEPFSGYLVGRLAREFREGKTRIGTFGTMVQRKLPDNLDFLRSAAYTLGTDFSHRFANNTYSLNISLVGSRIVGSQEAIELAQRSPARYYQRPDADHVTFDPTRTSLTGYAGSFMFAKNAGNWRGAIGGDTRSPGFEVNDLGFQQQADMASQWSWLSHRWLKPGKIFRRVQVNVNQWSGWNYNGDRLYTGGNFNWNYQLSNYWGGYMGLNRNLAGLSTGALRGGPAFVRPGAWNGFGGFNSDNRKMVRGGVNGWFWVQDEDGGSAYGISPNISLRPAGNLDFSIGPRFNKQKDLWQYLQTSTVFDNPEYLHGELRQTTVSMTFRGNFTFTPDLSLQVYAEPFISTGRYDSYRTVTDPRGATLADRFQTFTADQVVKDESGNVSLDFDRDGTTDVDLGNPDFTFLSFRSNFVLRWEYAPGSTVFFVWQHGRSDFSNDNQFHLGGGVKGLFEAPMANTFLVKVNYWLSP